MKSVARSPFGKEKTFEALFDDEFPSASMPPMIEDSDDEAPAASSIGNADEAASLGGVWHAKTLLRI